MCRFACLNDCLFAYCAWLACSCVGMVGCLCGCLCELLCVCLYDGLLACFDLSFVCVFGLCVLVLVCWLGYAAACVRVWCV